jgi:hypothetical protein
VGIAVGLKEGESVGRLEGLEVGTGVGCGVGTGEGTGEGNQVVGDKVGTGVGALVLILDTMLWRVTDDTLRVDATAFVYAAEEITSVVFWITPSKLLTPVTTNNSKDMVQVIDPSAKFRSSCSLMTIPVFSM